MVLSNSTRDALTRVKQIRDADGNLVQPGTPDSSLISVRSLPSISCEINSVKLRKFITETYSKSEGNFAQVYTLEEVDLLLQAESNNNSQNDVAIAVVTIPSKVTDAFKRSVDGRYVCADEICQTSVKAVAEKVKGIIFDFEPTTERLPIVMKQQMLLRNVNTTQFDQYYIVKWVTDTACYQGTKHHKNCSCKQQINKSKISQIKSDFRINEFFPRLSRENEDGFNLWGYLFEQGRVDITPKDLSEIVIYCLYQWGLRQETVVYDFNLWGRVFLSYLIYSRAEGMTTNHNPYKEIPLNEDVRFVFEMLLKHDDIIPFETLGRVPDSLGTLPKEIRMVKRLKAFQKFTDFRFLKQLQKTPAASRKSEVEQQKAKERCEQLVERINSRTPTEFDLWVVDRLENINEDISNLRNDIDLYSVHLYPEKYNIKAVDSTIINRLSEMSIYKHLDISSYLFELFCYGIYSTRETLLNPLDFIARLIASADFNNKFDNNNKINQWDLTQAGRYNLNKFEQSLQYLRDVQEYQECVKGALTKAIKYLEELISAP